MKTLKELIDEDIKKAMLSKDQDTLQALRSIKSMILLAETEKGAKETLDRDAEIKLLTKAAKQRRESAEIYKSQNRPDLEKIELMQLEVINRYLPAQLSEEEIKIKLQEIIKKLGASSASDMGKVMGIASKELAGMADGKLISSLVKSLLS